MSKSFETKKKIADSLKQLAATMSINKITIQNIVDNCSLNRQTFYYHFRDIFDLIEWIFTVDALAEQEALDKCRGDGYQIWQMGFFCISAYIEQNRKFCLRVYNSDARAQLDGFIHAALYDLLYRSVGELSRDKRLLKEDRERISGFYASAFCGLIMSWMANDLKEEPEAILEHLSRFMEGALENAIEKYSRKSHGLRDDTAYYARHCWDIMEEAVNSGKKSVKKLYKQLKNNG